MPCWTIQNVSVEWTPNTNPELLAAALKEMGEPNVIFDGQKVHFGWQREYIDCAAGKANVAPNRSMHQIKRAYSAQIVKAQAKAKGWTLKETAQYQYVITKR